MMAIETLAQLRQARRIVIKIGSALLVERGEPRAAWLAGLADEIASHGHSFRPAEPAEPVEPFLEPELG